MPPVYFRRADEKSAQISDPKPSPCKNDNARERSELADFQDSIRWLPAVVEAIRQGRQFAPRKQIMELASLAFVERAENVVFRGLQHQRQISGAEEASLAPF